MGTKMFIDIAHKFQAKYYKTRVLQEPGAFICKALKGEAIVNYCEPLITQQMKASGSPFG